MKRIKFMLLSLTLLAVVGGALAFKAKFITPICTTTTVGAGANPTCPSPRLYQVGGVASIYTTQRFNNSCTKDGLPLPCLNSTFSIPD